MELDSIKCDVRSLVGMHDDPDVNRDELVIATALVVRRAHIIANRLLLEGRYQELQRCLDLCYVALAPPADSSEKLPPRIPTRLHSLRGSLCIHSTGSGEPSPLTAPSHPLMDGPRGDVDMNEDDHSLFVALYEATLRIQRQFNSVRQTRPERGNDYFLEKVLMRKKDAADVSEPDQAESTEMAMRGWAFTRKGGAAATTLPPPPERGISIFTGKRPTAGTELPPLVTNIRHRTCSPSCSPLSCGSAELLQLSPQTNQASSFSQEPSPHHTTTRESGESEEALTSPLMMQPGSIRVPAACSSSERDEDMWADSVNSVSAPMRKLDSRTIRFYESHDPDAPIMAPPTVRRSRRSLTASWCHLSESTTTPNASTGDHGNADLHRRIARVKRIEKDKAREKYMQQLRGRSSANSMLRKAAHTYKGRTPRAGGKREPSPLLALLDGEESTTSGLHPGQQAGSTSFSPTPTYWELRSTLLIQSASEAVDNVSSQMGMRQRECAALLVRDRQRQRGGMSSIESSTSNTAIIDARGSTRPLSTDFTGANSPFSLLTDTEDVMAPPRIATTDSGGVEDFMDTARVLAFQRPPNRLLPDAERQMAVVRSEYETDARRAYGEITTMRERFEEHLAMVRPPQKPSAILEDTSEWKRRTIRSASSRHRQHLSSVSGVQSTPYSTVCDSSTSAAQQQTQLQHFSIPGAPTIYPFTRGSPSWNSPSTLDYPPAGRAAIPSFLSPNTASVNAAMCSTPMTDTDSAQGAHVAIGKGGQEYALACTSTDYCQPLCCSLREDSLSEEGRTTTSAARGASASHHHPLYISRGSRSVSGASAAGDAPCLTRAVAAGTYAPPLALGQRHSYAHLVHDMVLQHVSDHEKEKRHESLLAAWPFPGQLRHQENTSNGLRLFPPTFVESGGQRRGEYLPDRTTDILQSVRDTLRVVSSEPPPDIQAAMSGYDEDGCLSVSVPTWELWRCLPLCIATVRIQRVWRGHLARRQVAALQQLVRESREREALVDASTLSIQRVCRGYEERRQLALCRASKPNAIRRNRSSLSRRRSTLLQARRFQRGGGTSFLETLQSLSARAGVTRTNSNTTRSSGLVRRYSRYASHMASTHGSAVTFADDHYGDDADDEDADASEDEQEGLYCIPSWMDSESTEKLRSLQRTFAARVISHHYWRSCERVYDRLMLEANALAMMLSGRMTPEEALGAVPDNGDILERISMCDGSGAADTLRRENIENIERVCKSTLLRRARLRSAAASSCHEDNISTTSTMEEAEMQAAAGTLQRVGRAFQCREYTRSRNEEMQRSIVARRLRTWHNKGSGGAPDDSYVCGSSGGVAAPLTHRRPLGGVLKGPEAEAITSFIAKRHPDWF